MNIKEIAERYVQVFREGKDKEIYVELYGDNPVSIEMPGSPMERCEGMEAISKKGQWWYENVELHSSECSEPIISEDYFAVTFTIDSTDKNTGKRTTMSEVAVLKVVDRKIVQEQFFYGMEK